MHFFSLKRLIGFAALIAAIVMAVSVSAASADKGAFVANHGNNPGDTCSISAFGGYYSGFVTLVSTPSGKMHLGCTTMLSSGLGVSSTVILASGGEVLMLSPGGVGILVFNG